MVQQAVRSKIEETNAEFGAAISRGDTAATAALYTDDAVVLPPNAETVRGRQAIKGLFDGMIQQIGIPQLTLRTIQVDEIGDTANEVGEYTLKFQPAGGGQSGAEARASEHAGHTAHHVRRRRHRGRPRALARPWRGARRRSRPVRGHVPALLHPRP